jgi:hypothetical protein
MMAKSPVPTFSETGRTTWQNRTGRWFAGQKAPGRLPLITPGDLDPSRLQAAMTYGPASVASIKGIPVMIAPIQFWRAFV